VKQEAVARLTAALAALPAPQPPTPPATEPSVSEVVDCGAAVSCAPPPPPCIFLRVTSLWAALFRTSPSSHSPRPSQVVRALHNGCYGPLPHTPRFISANSSMSPLPPLPPPPTVVTLPSCPLLPLPVSNGPLGSPVSYLPVPALPGHPEMSTPSRMDAMALPRTKTTSISA
jgi:hypothetical protein